mmetsp:Transcript_57677/g.141446  ORF Transcript_57677/g.141446 Transcript_57677/m.141446 type:complete len:246 (+) Transcript_57677:415-1152(+)
MHTRARRHSPAQVHHARPRALPALGQHGVRDIRPGVLRRLQGRGGAPGEPGGRLGGGGRGGLVRAQGAQLAAVRREQQPPLHRRAEAGTHRLLPDRAQVRAAAPDAGRRARRRSLVRAQRRRGGARHLQRVQALRGGADGELHRLDVALHAGGAQAVPHGGNARAHVPRRGGGDRGGGADLRCAGHAHREAARRDPHTQRVLPPPRHGRAVREPPALLPRPQGQPAGQTGAHSQVSRAPEPRSAC